jgi:prolyl oligopeptidase
MAQSGTLVYPETRKVDTVTTYHGVKVADPYRWLEDDNSEETKKWVTAQNKVTNSYFENIPYRTQWLQRLEELNNYPKYGSPFRNNDYFYYYKNDGLQNQSVLYRQKGLDGKPELVLDPNEFSPDGTTSLAVFSLSKNGNFAVVGKSTGGSDWRTFYVMDMNTMKYLSDSLAWVKVSNVAWQGNGFYYSRYPKPDPGKELSTKNENHQVFYHAIGTPQEQDRLVYEDKANPQRFHNVTTNEDERFVLLNITDRGRGKIGNALYYYDNNGSDKTFKPIIGDVGNYLYSFVTEKNGRFLIATNDGAKNRRVVSVDPLHPDKANWKKVIDEKPENLAGISSAGNKLFVTYLKDVTSRVYVYSKEGTLEQEVKLPALGNASGFSGKGRRSFCLLHFYLFHFCPDNLQI